MSCQGHITLGGESELEPESSESGSSFLEGEQAEVVFPGMLT